MKIMKKIIKFYLKLNLQIYLKRTKEFNFIILLKKLLLSISIKILNSINIILYIKIRILLIR